ncbi:xanthine dehydrogenase family protein molybdopterin-binding subunit [Bradyrhizobium sp. AUGA SZCCT0283]|uniref:xanthine dehydrogenase family protein molybdopterin-binding subunit n=1 Tax=Bradyrhizobium sp. AUGA SZCCT0283 TaxID=2807671 RepID=UPI001BAE4E02|nr:molybdopterin cofactor-binding domain-containing protein [Bradyrhizobium sp. AUGA SZCCT0283]MBR1279293.1 xanthine dehydrogenase family protein molybdopterin-binding subunit [Bradyrhizobium sp. AUGA SZCCT0283]
MSRAGKIARRTFLIGSAAVAGGVAFGIYAYKRTPTNPLLRNLGDGQAALTPYVRLDQSGVTIITPRADVGQGAYSVQAALVAEELDLPWEQIKVDPGPPSAAYYNGKVLAEGLPFAATDNGPLARNARVLGDVGGKFLGLQITGGSSTVPDAYEKLRVAGAVAREVLLLAAARQTGIAKADLRTRNGAVVTPDGRSLSYASLAATAAQIDPPATATLKPESEWRYLGKSMRRIDMVAKCTGTAVFGIDLRMPGMVYATVRTNPRLGGGMKNHDPSAAAASKGVLKIVPITAGVGVIADNTWRAFKAANVIKFDWGPAPYPPTTAAMFETVGTSFVPARQDSRFKNEGNIEAALTGTGVIEAEYKVPYLAHAPLEPMNAVVQLKDGRLDIWTGTQIPMFMMAMAASMTGLRAENIHLHAQMSGGSFGARLEDDYVRQAIELAKAFPGPPIKMTWTREEDMTHDFPRPLAMARMRGAVKDGHVDAYDLSIACPSVTASQLGRQNLSIPGPDVAIVAGAWDQPFKIPNYRVTGYRVPELVPVSSWRSVGASGNGFLHDGFLDELIHAAGADPLKERLRLCWHEPSRKVLEAVGEMSSWGSDPGKDRGRGIAFTLSFGVPAAEVVEVTNTPHGIRIDKVFVAVEVGRVLDPKNFDNQVRGGVIWGLGHAMNAELTHADGIAQQTNYHAFEAMRLYQVPLIEVRALTNTNEVRGIGEPTVPPAAPALANAIFAATGKRIRELPLNKHIDFV